MGPDAMILVFWMLSFKPTCSPSSFTFVKFSTEAENIEKRRQKYTEELYKKDLHDSDNHDGVIIHSHPEPDLLECEVK